MSTAAPLPPSVVHGGLPTPDGTPEPEDARNKAEEKRKREEEKRQKEAEQAATTRFRERYDRAKSEIDRLQSSNAAEAPLAVLGVKEDDVSNITIARAFTELGCLVHYKYMPSENKEQAEKAFKDIMAAGEKLDVDLETRKEVQDWDGKKDLLRPIWLQERYELAENRINLLSDAESATNPLELLGLSSETASKAAVEWKITNLGCSLHYKYMPPDEQHQQRAKKAFDALMKVGETLNVGNNLLDAVRGWNGEQDLLGPLKSAYFKDRYDRAAAKLTKLEQHTVQDDPYGVLDLTMEDATDEVTDRQFKKLGCLLHPKYMPEEKRAKVKEAFDKILKAGEVLNVDEVDREAVENWDGEEDLLQEDATRLHPPNEVPEPPEAIKRLFEEATPHMVKLRDDPSDAGARTNLEQLNLRLREATGTYIAEAGAQLSDRIWEIQIDQFAMAFQQVKDLALKLAENPADASVQANLDITKRGIDNEIALKHFPQVWAAAPHQTNEIPEPPEAIKMLFEEATPHMVKLRDDPPNASARTNLEQLNLRLQEATRTYIAETRAQLSDDSWVIKISDFANAFQQVKDLVLKLAENPTDASAQADLNTAKQLVDDEIALKHFPQSWAVTEEQLGTTTTPAHEHDSQFFYPWPTHKTHMGKIIGLTKHGRGYRPIVEWMHEGKILRTLESPSEVGSDDVEAYLNTPKSKVFFGKELPKGKKPEDRPREWTRQDKDKIQHVDWATQSMVLRKNTARNDISGRCYVCFTLKEPLPDGRPNRDMVDISTLRRIFTESKADKLVADVCKRDKILPPWQAKPVSEFHDPSKKEKDVKERRLLRLELSQNSAHQRGADSTVSQHNRGHSSSGSSDVPDRGRSDGGSGGGSHENGNIDQRVTLLETSITQRINDLQMDIARVLEDTIKTALDAAVERQKSDLFRYIDEKIATAVASAFANGRS